MAKSSRRHAVKTLTIVKSRDIVVDRLIKPCEEENHSACTGWAVLKKELSPIDANYGLRCTCACHKKKATTATSKIKKPKKLSKGKKKSAKQKKQKRNQKGRRNKKGKKAGKR